MMPTPDTPTYITSEGVLGGMILLPIVWLKAATVRPIQAITRLLGVASLIRDDYFGLYKGSEFVFSRELRAGTEIQNSDRCVLRAEALQQVLLAQVYKIDQRQHHQAPKISKDLYTVWNKNFDGFDSSLFYLDPPTSTRRRQAEPEPDEPQPWGTIS
jgi:hypothetical protein